MGHPSSSLRRCECDASPSSSACARQVGRRRPPTCWSPAYRAARSTPWRSFGAYRRSRADEHCAREVAAPTPMAPCSATGALLRPRRDDAHGPRKMPADYGRTSRSDILEFREIQASCFSSQSIFPAVHDAAGIYGRSRRRHRRPGRHPQHDERFTACGIPSPQAALHPKASCAQTISSRGPRCGFARRRSAAVSRARSMANGIGIGARALARFAEASWRTWSCRERRAPSSVNRRRPPARPRRPGSHVRARSLPRFRRLSVIPQPC